MPKTQLPITGGFYESRSKPISNQQCINWYVNINQGDGLATESLFGTPGSKQLATTGEVQQSNRGSHVKNGVPYFVNGGKLYSFSSDFVLTELGDIEGGDRVSMADNGSQLIILVPGGKGYIYDENAGTPFQEITDLDFTANGNPQFVVYLDGYFVCTTDTKKFINSALNDGLSWDALDFGSAEADPDDIVAPIVHRNQLFIGGSETIEVFQNVGGAGFPFQRVQGFVIPKGIFAPYSIVQTGDTYLFIGGGVNESPTIQGFDGNDTIKVSTDAIDAILNDFTEAEINAAFSWYYSQAGSKFVGFVIADFCIVYDLTAKKWHERRSQIIDANGVRDLRWRINSTVKAYNRILVGDSQDGRIGDISLDYYDEYEGNIIRKVSTLPFANLGNSLTIPMLELTMEAGVGDLETIDPKIRLSTSRDGKTFSSERIRSIGKIGEYRKRSIWRRLGRFARFAVFQFTFSEKVKPVIIKLEANVL